MSVLQGEGTHPILYGSYPLPAGRHLPAYLARPDAAGSFPASIVAHGAWGLTPSVKAAARRLARHGVAAVCPDLYRGNPPATGDLDEAVAEFGSLPEGRAAADLRDAWRNATLLDWTSPASLLAYGSGGRVALDSAPLLPGLGAMVLMGTPLDAGSLGDIEVPLLGVYGGDAAAAVKEARDAAGHGEFTVYREAGDEFWDEGRPGYDGEAAEHAYERIVGFLLGAPVPTG
jgi:carboxymethylenebutenolidase